MAFVAARVNQPFDLRPLDRHQGLPFSASGERRRAHAHGGSWPVAVQSSRPPRLIVDCSKWIVYGACTCEERYAERVHRLTIKVNDDEREAIFAAVTAAGTAR